MPNEKRLATKVSVDGLIIGCPMSNMSYIYSSCNIHAFEIQRWSANVSDKKGEIPHKHEFRTCIISVRAGIDISASS